MQALLIAVHDDWYAIELREVREVVPSPVVTPLPGAPPGLLGVFNLRGEVLPLFDIGVLLGLAPCPVDVRVAVAATLDGPAGLTVAGQPERVELGDDAGPAQRPSGIARFAVGDRAVTLLDVDRLLGRAA